MSYKATAWQNTSFTFWYKDPIDIHIKFIVFLKAYQN